MNYMLGFAITLVCMLIAVFAYMLVVARKLQDVLDELDVIKFGVKDVIHDNDELIKNEIHSMIDIVERLIEIEKDFDSNIAKGTTDLVEVCKEHLCAIQDRCNLTSDRVRKMEKDLYIFGEQLSAITDHIRERTVEKDPFFDPEPLCDSCKYDTEEGLANICFNCSEKALCNYEPKNAFEQAGDV